MPLAHELSDAARREKKQLIHRLPPAFVAQTLKDFNGRLIDASSAEARLGVSHARLYQLRTDYLRDKNQGYQPKASGGDRREAWPPEAVDFLKEFLPLKSPPNYQFVADELERLCHFKRARSTVESYVKTHLAHLVPSPLPKNRTYRRFRRAHIGELWQHDNSIHQWWPAPRKQTLLLTIDDCSGLFVAGRFVESDTPWNHFEHFRQAKNPVLNQRRHASRFILARTTDSFVSRSSTTAAACPQTSKTATAWACER